MKTPRPEICSMDLSGFQPTTGIWIAPSVPMIQKSE
jgi:hypothetical protein